MQQRFAIAPQNPQTAIAHNPLIINDRTPKSPNSDRTLPQF
ncbi:MAG: hypothetical protein ACKO11_08480 [Cuspidothrix sp.]